MKERLNSTERQRQWRQNNPDKYKAAYTNWRSANRIHVRAYNAEWRKTPKGQLADRRRLLKQYGITIEQFNEMLISQASCCAVCRTNDPGGSGDWHIDHNHITRKVRGLLCAKCNLALGLLGDSATKVAAAARYLSESEHEIQVVGST